MTLPLIKPIDYVVLYCQGQMWFRSARPCLLTSYIFSSMSDVIDSYPRYAHTSHTPFRKKKTSLYALRFGSSNLKEMGLSASSTTRMDKTTTILAISKVLKQRFYIFKSVREKQKKPRLHWRQS